MNINGWELVTEEGPEGPVPKYWQHPSGARHPYSVTEGGGIDQPPVLENLSAPGVSVFSQPTLDHEGSSFAGTGSTFSGMSPDQWGQSLQLGGYAGLNGNPGGSIINPQTGQREQAYQVKIGNQIYTLPQSIAQTLSGAQPYTKYPEEKTPFIEKAVLGGLMSGVGGLAFSGAGLGAGVDAIGGSSGIGDLIGGAAGDTFGGISGGGMSGSALSDSILSEMVGGGLGNFAGGGVGSFGGTSIMDLLKSAGSAAKDFGITDILKSVAGPAISGVLGYNAANNAADIQKEGTDAAIGESRRQYDQNRADLMPWLTAGAGAVGKLSDLIGLNGKNPGDIMAMDPGYQFRLGEGNKAIENAAKARGMYFSPSTVKELTRYGQDYASNEFGNVYNRVAGVSGTGQTAGSNLANLGTSMSGNISNLITGGANARGAAAITGSNAVGNAIAGGFNNYNQNQLLDRILSNQGWR